MTPKQQTLVIQRAVNAEVAKQAEKWRVQTAQQMYAIFLTVLHDKHQFTPYSLIKVFGQCTDQFNNIGDKYVKIEDFYKLLEDMGIAIT